MKLWKDMEDLLEQHEISHSGTEKQGKEYWTELEWYSPAGEDVIITVWHDNTKKGFAKGLADYAKDFDVDEHVELWADSRGQRGVPGTIRELLDDAEAIKQHLEMVSQEVSRLVGKEKESKGEKKTGEHVKNGGLKKAKSKTKEQKTKELGEWEI